VSSGAIRAPGEGTSLSAIAEGEYARDFSHDTNPAAHGANGPDTVATHTFLPIAASDRLAQHGSPKPRRSSHDSVERLTVTSCSRQ
jgi:hypothetical protein